MDAKERQQVLEELKTIRGAVKRIRDGCAIPLVQSCARWCDTYCRIAQWSLGEGDRFEFMED